MKSCSTNDVKVYNLSAGKTLPEWISERKRRSLSKSSSEIRRRIELIQDFDMPGLSSSVQMSRDGGYILATGIYKPRVRVYDVANLSMKFERCFDSEVVRFETLSEDYGKLAFLQVDRWVEIHSQAGRYFRLRIPKEGRDLAYHSPSCDLLLGGASRSVYRLNLELGRFMTPWETGAQGINRIEVNQAHGLVLLGTEEGRVEAWDPRAGKVASILDVAMAVVEQEGVTSSGGIPSVTSLKFKDGLTLGVGTASGQVLLYDVRSAAPLIVKDHYYGLAIKALEFHPAERMVLSMDAKVVKVWREEDGSPFTSVEGEGEAAAFNDLCLVGGGSGMFFVANEAPKMLVYYIPSLGPAPRWCSFLDNLTEELEESSELGAVYEDYKFVTEEELGELGLSHLVGSSLLKAYMHGYFMDMRLYRKAKALAQPFEFADYKRRKILERAREEGRGSRVVKVEKLPKVNRDLAAKVMGQPSKGGLLEDSRFKSMWEDPDFEIDKGADEYRLLNPVLSKLDKKKEMKKLDPGFTPVEEEKEEGSSDDDDLYKDSSSSEDEEEEKVVKKGPKFYELKTDEGGFKMPHLKKDQDNKELQKKKKAPLGDRLVEEEEEGGLARGPLGNREMTFSLKPKNSFSSRGARARESTTAAHVAERRQIRRSAPRGRGRGGGGGRGGGSFRGRGGGSKSWRN